MYIIVHTAPGVYHNQRAIMYYTIIIVYAATPRAQHRCGAFSFLFFSPRDPSPQFSFFIQIPFHILSISFDKTLLFWFIVVITVCGFNSFSLVLSAERKAHCCCTIISDTNEWSRFEQYMSYCERIVVISGWEIRDFCTIVIIKGERGMDGIQEGGTSICRHYFTVQEVIRILAQIMLR